MADEGETVNIDREWAEGTMDEASRYVAEIVEMFTDVGDTSKAVCDEGSLLYYTIFLLDHCFLPGCSLIDSLKLASVNLGVADVRHLNDKAPPLLDQIKSFCLSSQEFNQDKGLKIHFLLGKLAENRERLDILLAKPWNAKLTGDCVDIIKSDEEEGDEADGDYLFKLATPLKVKASFSCEHCTYTVSNHVVFKRHLRAKHGVTMRVEAPRVTCMLPHQQTGTRVIGTHTMDQICSHLREVCF